MRIGVFASIAKKLGYGDEHEAPLQLLKGKNYISRSEARRLLVNLDRFQQIELVFAGVESIGQGFADEVFRVFPGHHRGTVMEPVNAKPAVAAMIRHVEEEANRGLGSSGPRT